MADYFDIFGTPIKFSEIKDFRIVQKEYIYRPIYREAEKSFANALLRKKYEFGGMQPYAAIFDESSHKSAIASYKAKNFKESIGKDLAEGALTTIGDKLNIKALRAKKYKCVNQAGRIFTTYMEDIPALLVRMDGKASDVQKNDELYTLLGEPIAPAINIVHALVIHADEEYIFYGNGIQIEDIGAEYERLKYEMNVYNESKIKEKTGSKFALPKIPKIALSLNKNNKENLEE